MMPNWVTKLLFFVLGCVYCKAREDSRLQLEKLLYHEKRLGYQQNDIQDMD